MKRDNSTKLIRSGLKRTEFMETSEPLFLTSGFVYNSAEEAEDAFKSAMQDKIGAALEVKRREVANNFVKTKIEDDGDAEEV